MFLLGNQFVMRSCAILNQPPYPLFQIKIVLKTNNEPELFRSILFNFFYWQDGYSIKSKSRKEEISFQDIVTKDILVQFYQFKRRRSNPLYVIVDYIFALL